MQVTLNKKDVISKEAFFFGGKSLTVRITDKYNRTIEFKTHAEVIDYENYRIVTRGVYRGGTIGSYRLPISLGNMEELYGFVGEQLGRMIRNILDRDKQIVARLRRFQTEG